MWHLATVFVVTTFIASLVFCYYRRLFAVLARCFTYRKLGVASCFAKAFFELATRSPSPVVVTLGKFVTVIVTKPEHMQIVLNSPHCLSKPVEYSFFRVNRGLFGAPAHIWSHERKMFSPSFGSTILPRFVDIMNAKMALFAQLQQKYVGIERNFLGDIERCFIDTIMTTSLGQDLDLQRTSEGSTFVQLQDEFLHLASRRVFTPWLHSERLYKLTNAYKRECEILKFAYKIIDKCTQKTIEENTLSSNETGPKTFAGKLLEIIHRDGVVNVPYIRDHVLTIFLAGSDTSMTTVGNTLLMLAIHQDVQERVYQELVDVIGTDQNKPISLNDATKMTYLEMVCKETMRLFPIAGLIGRKASKDIILDANTTIPAKATVTLVFYQLHRDLQIWGPNAAEFDPERFRPEIAAGRHPYAYLPFSGGPRMCIGVRYAWLSMKIMLGHVLRRYRTSTSLTMGEISLDYSILLRIKQGCQISLEER